MKIEAAFKGIKGNFKFLFWNYDLLKHLFSKGIAEFGVFGLPDLESQEVVAAAVVRSNDGYHVTEEEILDTVNNKVQY